MNSCTNAIKFGALSVPGGQVEISWATDEPALRLHFTWKEHGGPMVQAPTRQSFGTRLIETIGRQLKGDVKLAYESGGFKYKLDVPMASLTS